MKAASLKKASAIVLIMSILFGIAIKFYDRVVSPQDTDTAPALKGSNASSHLSIAGSADGAAIINGNQSALTVNTSPVFAKPADIQWLRGIWGWEYEYPNSSAMIKMKGTTEYFDNGSYTVKGLMRIVSQDKKKPGEAEYQVYGSGDWQLHDSKLIDRLNEFKSFPPKLVVNGQRMSLPLQDETLNLEKYFPKGMSSEYEILERDANYMVVRTRNLQGDPLRYRSTRQKSEFLFDPS